MRLWVLGLSLWLVGCEPAPPSTPTTSRDLSWLDARSAQQALAAGEVSSEQLVQFYLKQIATHNQQGHQLHAITDINPDALALAKALDQERAAGKIRSPLHGLPVVLKANIATADQMPTTAGALALQGHLTTRDAELVHQLREAGAVLLAKTNLSEWANFRGENSASGWSALGGQSRNPHLLTHTPCGSSSGSGVAVAADLALLAVGTETDGSIICPSAINGIVGIKPTRGAVSGEGIIPIASAQDIAGPMTRRVYDAALLLEAMLTPEARKAIPASLTAAALQPASAGKVLLVRAYDDREAAIAPMLDNTAAVLTAAGFEVVQTPEWQLPSDLYQAEFSVLLYEYARDLQQWLTDYQVSEQVNTLQKIVAFNRAQGERALAFFGQEYLEQAAALDLVAAETDYIAALAQSRALAEAALNQYLQQGFSAIILPSYGPAWPIDHVNGDQFNFGTSTAAAVAGYPSITLPGGYSGVLPLGISLVGLPWSEPELIRIAALLEQQLAAYRRPGFIPALQADNAQATPAQPEPTQPE
ncbi:amidase [Alishewanella sp. WH16-1]|uniref:amidase n=1 Tax=Alishewanella sp. WH16-1 TaxID=1651088 RepID=UPI00070EA6A1|nr:amidase [Alishewanella sp. WH16-1]KRS19996.1 amidase [Alishewanella sp. WH16-1]